MVSILQIGQVIEQEATLELLGYGTNMLKSVITTAHQTWHPTSRLAVILRNRTQCRHFRTLSTRSFTPKVVPRVALNSLTTDTSVQEFMQRARETPIHIVPGSSGTSQDYGAVLRDLADDPDASQCVVELEVGRYDKDVQKVQLPLSFYLDWLVRGDESGQMNGKQVYLAQWRGLQDVS